MFEAAPALEAGAAKPQNAAAPARPPRPARSNYNKIHSRPLPLTTFPLPAFIPQNPLSWLHVIYAFLSQVATRPSSHPDVPYQAQFSPETRSVHVTDPVAIRALWECGFFGKGNLSRSELSWLERERNRRGSQGGPTSEEHTAKRRNERKEFKKERARKEREDIEKQLLEEGKIQLSQEEPDALSSPLIGNSSNGTSNKSVSFLNPSQTEQSGPYGTDANPTPQQTSQQVHFPHNLTPTSTRAREVPNKPKEDDHSPENQEHLQLTLEEAFFLSYGLNVLAIRDTPTSTPLQTARLLSLFRQYSYFPPSEATRSLRPDDPFLLQYVVYHHFRSLGWVVRPGVKFAVDYLLYKRGPVFSHAEFAVVIIPSYGHAYWTQQSDDVAAVDEETLAPPLSLGANGQKPWWWLHCVNRVQSQVRKSLVLVYVEVPPPPSPSPLLRRSSSSLSDEEDELNITRLLKSYRISEVNLKRWTPNRSRD
ncbi:MAG: hypothetical protein M1825_005962 [Sarcosagium campestre]|nr:MAG: hypothetical protein M1825_005962 [Sarcosagium campestre]